MPKENIHIEMTLPADVEDDLDEHNYESEMVQIGVTELESIEQSLTLLVSFLEEKQKMILNKSTYEGAAIAKKMEEDTDRAEESANYVDNLLNQSCLES